MADVLKELAEHESGEKLLEAIELHKKVHRTLGAGVIDEALLAEANRLYRHVFREQSQNKDALLALVRPVLPAMAATCTAQVLNSSLRGAFHSIGNWTRVIELGKEGLFTQAVAELKWLWVAPRLTL